MNGAVSWIALGIVAAAGGAGVAVLGKVGMAGMDPALARITSYNVCYTKLLRYVAALESPSESGDSFLRLIERLLARLVFEAAGLPEVEPTSPGPAVSPP